jgi:putative FmdB family regulatory protein
MTYEYICEACGHQWEAEQSIKDSALKVCEACGKSKAKRLVSGGTGFLLKGGGWYADGYGSSAGAAKPSSDDAGKASTAKSEGSSESKPTEAKTSESKPSGDAKPAAGAGSGSSGAAPAAPSTSAKAS